MRFDQLLTALNARVKIAVGNCALGHEWRDWPDGTREEAHAHFNERGWMNNWICIRDWNNIATPSGRVKVDMIHELAHLLAPHRRGEALHSERWRRAMRELGQRPDGTIDPVVENEIENELSRKAASRRKHRR